MGQINRGRMSSRGVITVVVLVCLGSAGQALQAQSDDAQVLSAAIALKLRKFRLR